MDGVVTQKDEEGSTVGRSGQRRDGEKERYSINKIFLPASEPGTKGKFGRLQRQTTEGVDTRFL